MRTDSAGFPDIVRELPEADLPFSGLKGWLISSETGQILFNQSDVVAEVPEHAHGAQWGIVISGKIELTIDGKTDEYVRGDTYFIPNKVPHGARIFPGFRAVDYFTDQNRYSTK